MKPQKKVAVIISIVSLLITSSLIYLSSSVYAAVKKDCSLTSTAMIPRIGQDLIPLNEMAADEYYPDATHPLRQEGGLYGGGSNVIPPSHYQKLVEATSQIQPLDADGNPDPVNGKIGVISVGMSNTRNEFDGYINTIKNESDISDKVVFVNGAYPGMVARSWSGRDGEWPWDYLEERIDAAGLTPAQVQVAWVKLSNSFPLQPGPDDYPKFPEDVYRDMTIVTDYLDGFPSDNPYHHPNPSTILTNIKVAYLSSRIYGGYSLVGGSPEPSAYENAFALRWLIEDQQERHEPNLSVNTTVPYTDVNYGNSPVVVWGPYMWANGVIPRLEPLLGAGEYLVWECDDLTNDGVHPSMSAIDKVATMLGNFFKTDPLTNTWFLGEGSSVPDPTPTPAPSISPTPTYQYCRPLHLHRLYIVPFSFRQYHLH
jgi:hypothetical protein